MQEHSIMSPWLFEPDILMLQGCRGTMVAQGPGGRLFSASSTAGLAGAPPVPGLKSSCSAPEDSATDLVSRSHNLNRG